MKISIYLASSINGMISNKKGVPDWLSKEYEEGFFSITQQTKAVIMGRKTYDILAPDYLPLKNEGTLLVMTHNAPTKGPSNVIFTDKKPSDIVAMLASRGHSEAVIIGGTITVSDFIKAGLVDEIILVVEPVLFGAGLPMLKDVDLEPNMVLADMKKLNENTVQLHYRIKSRLTS
jgi:dihydrofolate reductase